MAKKPTKPEPVGVPEDYKQSLHEADRRHTRSGEKTYVGPVSRPEIGSLLLDVLRVEDIVRSCGQHLGAHVALRDDLRTISRLAAWVSVTASYLSTRAALQTDEANRDEQAAALPVPQEEDVSLSELDRIARTGTSTPAPKGEAP